MAVSGDNDAGDGVRIVCGDGETDGNGCGEPFYLNFVRFVDEREVDPTPDSEWIELARERLRGPRWPDGPRLK